MSHPENVFLHEASPTNGIVDTVEESPLEDDDAELRRLESGRTRAWVLIGSAITQLPIWGSHTTMPPLKSRNHIH
jgi:hypothetical protein